MTVPAVIQAFAASIDRLAAPSSEQIEYLEALGVSDLLDELALEFDDLYKPRAVKLERMSPDLARSCSELDRLLTRGDLGWTTADLDSAAWRRVRAAASQAGAELHRVLKEHRHDL